MSPNSPSSRTAHDDYIVEADAAEAACPCTIAFSTHPRILDKPAKSEPIDYGRHWVQAELEPTDLAQLVLQGNAIAPQYVGRRVSENFERAGFLAVDIDRGMTLEEALADEFVKAHASFMYTTASHTADAHRFRIVFALEADITNGRDWANASLGLAVKLGGDQSIRHAACFFCGNRAAALFKINQTLPPARVDDLIRLGRRRRPVIRDVSRARAKALGPLKHDVQVRLRDGTVERLSLLNGETSIFCPLHDDHHPSALVVKSSRTGTMGIHCRTCEVTVWTGDGEDRYDFGAFKRLFDRVLADEERIIEEAQRGDYDDFFPPAPKISRSYDKYLKGIGYQPGITLVRSPKGSGKTEALIGLIESIRQRFEREGSKAEIRSVLLIGHRVLLLREAAKKLGLHSYQNGPSTETDGLKTLAVCVDSLPNHITKGGEYDLVILDESEQIFSHLMGKTVRDRKGGLSKIYSRLALSLKHAKAVIALDADMGMLTTHALSALRPDAWADSCRIIWNEERPAAQPRQYYLYDDKATLEDELLSAVGAGKRCFVATNSKKLVDVLAHMIKIRRPSTKLLAVSGDNSRDPGVKEFIENIKTRILDYQVVICSPSLGTGVDITFKDAQVKIDEVFGFFQGGVNTHTDIDQQLARVRHPGNLRVWVDPKPMNYISAFEQVRDDLGRAHFIPQAVIEDRDDGMVIYDKEHPLLLIATHVTAAKWASHNRLKELFVALRRQNGWFETLMPRRAVAETRALAKKARDIIKTERETALLTAPSLSPADFHDLDLLVERGAHLSLEERTLHHRNEIEHRLGIELSQEVVALDQGGRLLDRIERLDKVFVHPEATEALLTDQYEIALSAKGRLTHNGLEFLLRLVLHVTGLTDANGLNREAQVRTESLRPFARVVERNRVLFEEVVGQPVRSDIRLNPVRQLNAYLALLGLKLEQSARRKKAGVITRSYGWDLEQFDLMNDLQKRFRTLKVEREMAAFEREKPLRLAGKISR
jgi:hypothetical protein